MMSIRISFVLALLCACVHQELPKPVVPLVPTPQESWRRQAPEAALPAQFELPQTANSALPNGIALMAAEIPDAPYTDMIVVVTHDLDEGAAMHLAAALTESARRDGHSLCPLSISAARGALQLRWRCEPGRLEAGFELAATLLSRPPSHDIAGAVERSVELANVNAALNVSAQVIGRLRKRTSGTDCTGPYVETAEKSGRSVRSLFESVIDPARIAIIVAGAIDSQGAHVLAAKYFGRLMWRGAPIARAELPIKSRSDKKPILFMPCGLRAPLLGFAVAAPTSTHFARVDAEVLAHMLGNGVSSLLNASMRENSGLTYYARVDYEAGPDGGMLYGVLAVEPERLLSAITLLRENLARVRSLELPELFSSAREYTRMGLRQIGHRADLTALRLASTFIAGRGAEPPMDDLARLDVITAHDVQALAQRIMSDPLFIVAGDRSLLAALQWDGASVEYNE
jgi:hypothetical protein